MQTEDPRANQSNLQPTEKEKESEKENKSGIEKSSLIVSIIAALITTLLAVYNGYMSSKINEAELRIKQLDVEIKDKAHELDVSKEKIARFTWIQSLFGDLINEKDEKKRSYTVNLIRLSLTDKEAEQFFAGLQASYNRQLQIVGQNGFYAIQSEPIARLVGQLNSPSNQKSQDAFSKLQDEYRDSSMAINLILNLFAEGEIDNLSPHGLKLALRFLENTDPSVWNPNQIKIAEGIIDRNAVKETDSKTNSVFDEFESFLKTVVRAN